MTPWGFAIQELLKKAERSRRHAGIAGLASYSAFSQWKTSKRGPNIATLDRLLTGLGLTWNDWAEAFERAKAAALIDTKKEIEAQAYRPQDKARLRLVP